MVDLFRQIFTPRRSAKGHSAPLTVEEAEEEARAARRAQITHDLIELQRIAMAELALRKQQDDAAAKAGFDAEDQGPEARVLIV